MEEELDLFEALICNAMAKVDQIYYATTYHSIAHLHSFIGNRQGRLIDSNYERFGERIFCYELYHQLRIEIDRIRKGRPFLEGTLLQGEVTKWQVEQIVDHLDLERLSLNKMFDIIYEQGNLKTWWYGHFHDTIFSTYLGVNFNLLDISEFKILNI